MLEQIPANKPNKEPSKLYVKPPEMFTEAEEEEELQRLYDIRLHGPKKAEDDFVKVCENFIDHCRTCSDPEDVERALEAFAKRNDLPYTGKDLHREDKDNEPVH